MKSKFILAALTFAVLLSMSACKSKESAYKAAYEAAKEREMTTVEETTPVEKPTLTTTAPIISQKEKVTPIDYNGIKQFSVVVGSFVNRTNATSLKSDMDKMGYNAFLAQNERQMYRVIIATFDEKSDAAKLRDQIKSQFYPDKFQDAWILEQQY